MLATLGSGEVRGLGPLGAPVDEAVADDGAVRFHLSLKSRRDNLHPSEVQCFVKQHDTDDICKGRTRTAGEQSPTTSRRKRHADTNTQAGGA